MRPRHLFETRSDDDDPIAAAARAVEEMRTASETFRTDLTARVTGLTTRFDSLETRMGRPGAAAGTDDAVELEQRAFGNFLRHGREYLPVDEVRALRVADSFQGGFLAPEAFVAELDRNLVLFSQVRQVARVAGTTAGSVRLPKRTANLTAQWVGEVQLRPRSEPLFGMTDLTVSEIACYVDVSNTLMEDAAIDLASELSYDFAEEFGRAEGAAFVNGDGIAKPLGFLNTPGIPTVSSVMPVVMGTGAFDSLISLFYALPTAYATNAVWGMNRSTIGFVRKLKDAQGRYLWTDPLSVGQPATILGRPVWEFPDMPDVAVGATPIVFGDFSNYRIFDRVALSVLRDPYSIATYGQTRFHARRRVAGGVTKPEAFRLQKITG